MLAWGTSAVTHLIPHTRLSAQATLAVRFFTLPFDRKLTRDFTNIFLSPRSDAEATLLIYDPTKITYTQLLEFFYKMHDPTTLNQQGPDRGTQYRSGIFYHDEQQEKIARDITKKVNEQWWGGKVVTEILPAKQWWDAEAYHQEYLTKNPYGYECPSHFLRQFPELN